MASPTKVVAVDWSGAAVGEARHLWLAEADPVSGRLAHLANYRRDQVAARLQTLADQDPNLLVGLDFGFSFPAWWLAECGVADPSQLWADAGRLEGWLTSCQPPFWGRPGRRRPRLTPVQEWRQTELFLRPRPKSVFQIGGAGAVGTASLRGMPVLHQLRQAGFAIWPFDPVRPPLIAEVWPRLFEPQVKKSRRDARRAWLARHRAAIPEDFNAVVEGSADAFDATAAALGLARGRGRLPGDGRWPGDGRAQWPAASRHSVVRQEGWIWGVPMPVATVRGCLMVKE